MFLVIHLLLIVETVDDRAENDIVNCRQTLTHGLLLIILGRGLIDPSEAKALGEPYSLLTTNLAPHLGQVTLVTDDHNVPRYFLARVVNEVLNLLFNMFEAESVRDVVNSDAAL